MTLEAAVWLALVAVLAGLDVLFVLALPPGPAAACCYFVPFVVGAVAACEIDDFLFVQRLTKFKN